MNLQLSYQKTVNFFYFDHIQGRIMVKRAWVVLEVWIRCEATHFTYTTVDWIIQAMLWGYAHLIGEILLHILLSMPAFPNPTNLALYSLWGVPDTAYKSVRCPTPLMGCSVLGWVYGIYVPTSQSFALPSPPCLPVCAVALLSWFHLLGWQPHHQLQCFCLGPWHPVLPWSFQPSEPFHCSFSNWGHLIASYKYSGNSLTPSHFVHL